MNESERTTVGTPLWVFQSASLWNWPASESAVMITYSTGLPSTEGTWVAANVRGWRESGSTADSAIARRPSGERRNAASSHSGTIRSRFAGAASPGSSSRRSRRRVRRSSWPVEASQRTGQI